MNSVTVHLLNHSYAEKPDKRELAKISQCIATHIVRLDLETLAKETGEKGKPFTPAVFSKSRKAEYFQEQQVFALDFDCGISEKEILARAETYQIRPAFLYATYHYTKECPRFRAVFINNCILNNRWAASVLLGLLLILFPEADSNCKDVSRLFLGGIRLLYFNGEAEINLKDTAVSVMEKIKAENPSNFSRQIQSIGRKLGIATDKNLLGIYRWDEIEDLEEIWALPSILFIGEAQNSSKSYAMLARTPHTQSRHPKEALEEIRGQDAVRLSQVCPLFKDFCNGDLPHEHKFLLATNLASIRKGKTFFFEQLRKNQSKWRIEWDYIKKHSYSPMSCEKGNCPYSTQCGCRTLYEKLRQPIQKIQVKDSSYVSLTEACQQLRKNLLDALDDPRNAIHLITAQTALGKTTAYCQIMEERTTEEKPVMIAVPTIKLQKEVSERLLQKGVSVYQTPNLKGLLEQLGLSDLKDEIQYFYEKGFSHKVKRQISEFLEQESLTKYQHAKLNDYLQMHTFLQEATCVVTTHNMLLSLPPECLQRYEILVDEDLLMTIFKATASVPISDLQHLLETDVIPCGVYSRLQELCSLPDGYTGKTGLSPLSPDQLDRLYELGLPLESSISEFMKSDTCFIDQREQRIHYFTARRLPEQKLILVSATLNIRLYQDYCPNRRIINHQISEVKYAGNLVQYTHQSMSRSCIDTNGKEWIWERIHALTGKSGIPEITFRRFAPDSDIYFGKTEGFNDYEGRDLVIIGTPHNVPFLYILLGAYLGYACDSPMTPQRIQHNGYSFPIMTFSNEAMRNLQFYFLESELEQAIGRARLLRHTCTVYLFSNFPCRQAQIRQQPYLQLPKSPPTGSQQQETLKGIKACETP